MSNSTDKEKELEKPEPKVVDEKLLEKLAAEELLREACQGAIRAEVVGPSGWIKNKNPKTNKKFLTNTLRNAISSNNYNFNKKKDHSWKVNSRDSKSYEEDRSVRYKPYHRN